MQQRLSSLLCALAVCASPLASAAPILVPDDDGAPAPEFEQQNAPAPTQLSAPRPGDDLRYLMPGGAGIQQTSYYPGIQQGLLRPEYALTNLPPPQEDGMASNGMGLMSGSALVFVLVAKRVARKRRMIRKKYRLIVGTKAEYKREAA
jgi:hypothetical protein